MAVAVSRTTVPEILPFREAFRREMGSQITTDSLHDRPGWTVEYRLEVDRAAVGYGSIAIAGPWTGQPTIIDFYVLQEWRHRAFELFDVFLIESGADHFEIQSNTPVLPQLMLAYGRDMAAEAIIFAEGNTTDLPANGAVLRSLTDERSIRDAIRDRAGGGEWVLEVDGREVARGGILFHYNVPFGDIYMEVGEQFRRRGNGAYLVQELKRVCRELGAIPCARTGVDNVASRRTLQKAGFVPTAARLVGKLPFRGQGG